MMNIQSRLSASLGKRERLYPYQKMTRRLWSGFNDEPLNFALSLAFRIVHSPDTGD